MSYVAFSLPTAPWALWFGAIAIVWLLVCLPRFLGIVYIPHTQVGIIEKIWSGKGSLQEGQIIARNGEAGFQARFLRGGIHLGLYPWQYRIHKEPLVIVAEGKMAYVYARDGVPLEPVQPLAEMSRAIISRTRSGFLKQRVGADANAEFSAKVSTRLTWRCSL